MNVGYFFLILFLASIVCFLVLVVLKIINWWGSRGNKQGVEIISVENTYSSKGFMGFSGFKDFIWFLIFVLVIFSILFISAQS
ncbi:MAG: hypothetical protein QG579_394 [Patescibacteria group bacterium]|jgi:hypothetical protein|nr:hypothetical protein [Patescibacteria group bacterium]